MVTVADACLDLSMRRDKAMLIQSANLPSFGSNHSSGVIGGDVDKNRRVIGSALQKYCWLYYILLVVAILSLVEFWSAKTMRCADFALSLAESVFNIAPLIRRYVLCMFSCVSC